MRYLIAALILLAAHPAFAAWTIPNGGGRATLQTPHVRHVQVPAMTAGTAADQATDATYGTVGCLEFPTSADKNAYFQFEVGEDWTGGNYTVEIDWFPVTAMTAGQTVAWVITYVSVAEGEVIGGSVTTVPVTYTSPGGGTAQYKTIHTPFTFAFDDATNPLAHEDHIYIRILRDVSEDDFTGGACAAAYEIIYTSDGFPESN